MSANACRRAPGCTAVRRKSTDATTMFGLKPSSTEARFLNVRPKSSAPITSTIESATCTTTNSRRSVTASCLSTDDRLPGWVVIARSRRVAWSAGLRPNNTHVRTADTAMNRNTRQSGARSMTILVVPALRNLTSIWLSQRASSSPPSPPNPARSALSDSI